MPTLARYNATGWDSPHINTNCKLVGSLGFPTSDPFTLGLKPRPAENDQNALATHPKAYGYGRGKTMQSCSKSRA